MKHEVVQAILSAIEEEWGISRLTLEDGKSLDVVILGLEMLDDVPHVQVIEGHRSRSLSIDAIASVVRLPADSP